MLELLRSSLAGLALAMVGCTLDHGPVTLAGELQSRTTVDETRQQLKAKASVWRVVEESDRPGRGEQPGFAAEIVSVGEVGDLDTIGELRLLFVNGRLVTTWFYPTDAPTYRARLEASRGVALRGDGVVDQAEIGGLRVVSAKDLDGRPYVSLSDIALDDQRTAWLSKYASVITSAPETAEARG